MRILSKLASFLSPTPSPVTAEPLYPEATSELAVLSRLVADPALSKAFQAFGLQQEDLVARLGSRDLRDRQVSLRAFNQVRTGALSASAGATGMLSNERSPKEDLLAYLITLGSEEITEVIADLGVDPGAAVFWLAHRNREDKLRSGWPEVYPNGARAVLVNDPYSPMEAVLSRLIAAFSLPHEAAVQLMLRIHNEGEVHLDLPKDVPPVSFCAECNRHWRSAAIPLYVRPLASNSDA
jgi:hypothetical protein